MLTYQLFLGHNDQARLEFYQQYVDLPREYQTAEAVAKLRRVSSTSVYRMIQIISDELNELRGERGLKYVPTSAPILKKFNIPAPAYAVYLMRKSLVGQFMLAVVQHPEWTVKDFAVAQNTSTATVSRRLKNMSAFLRRFDLRLAFNPIGLCGNEMVARVALSEILWQICQDGTQLFPELGDLPEESATRIEAAKLVMPNFAHSRLQVICAVNIIRANQHHELPAMRPLEEVLTVTGSKDLAGHIPALGHELPNTMALIHLQSMLGAGFHVPQEPLLARFIGYHARMNTAEWQLVTLVIKRVKAVAGIDEHQLEDQVLIANLLSITVAMNLL
ncbi:helix-turn-helix domain-containing protein [Lacticaseibacillus hulanensis]|uniref:helix-turn-helix domain-containing protein n=1 Tax=Lacticaseibacillus hulanensis TaxID=2493111 RepID=UPI0013E2F068|nr:helix-turn-helix domain-containing protein [Lacticaseibacillus hulanensis]